jgi:hypothetical protein
MKVSVTMDPKSTLILGSYRRIVGGKAWQVKLYNREDWKKLLRMAKNRHILHLSME